MQEFLNLTLKKYTSVVRASFKVAAGRKLKVGCSLPAQWKKKFHRSWTSRPAQCGLGLLSLLLHREPKLLPRDAWNCQETGQHHFALQRTVCCCCCPAPQQWGLSRDVCFLLCQISESLWTLGSVVSWWSQIKLKIPICPEEELTDALGVWQGSAGLGHSMGSDWHHFITLS